MHHSTDYKKANKKPSRWWMRGVFEDRNKHWHNLLDTLRLGGEMDFRNIVLMLSSLILIRMKDKESQCVLAITSRKHVALNRRGT